MAASKKKFAAKGKSGPRHPELHDGPAKKPRSRRFRVPPWLPKPKSVVPPSVGDVSDDTGVSIVEAP